MTASAIAVSPATSINLNHPALNTPQPDDSSADAYSPGKLLAGLCQDANGHLRLKPEIERRLSPTRMDRIGQLLQANRLSDANSLAACRQIHKVQEYCPEGHMASAIAIRCAKLFLCGDCASPASRLHKFHYDHPYLYEHLMSSEFTVLTFTITEPPDAIHKTSRANLEKAQSQFKSFVESFDGDRGWYFLAGFSFHEEDGTFFRDRTAFYAIHQGPSLPGWPELNARWKSFAGPRARVKARLFDGRGSDTQQEGLKLALSGFVDYYHAAADSLNEMSVLEYSEQFRSYDTATPYGTFRGFDTRVEQERKAGKEPPKPVDIDTEGNERVHASTCGTCGKALIRDNRMPLMTTDELDSKYQHVIFGHSTRVLYGRNLRVSPISAIGDHAPPS